jgi:hypothetical protein
MLMTDFFGLVVKILMTDFFGSVVQAYDAESNKWQLDSNTARR